MGKLFSVCACWIASGLCLTLCYPMDCSPPDSSVHGILQARILDWVAMPSPRGSSWPRGWTHPCLLCLLHCQADSLLCCLRSLSYFLVSTKTSFYLSSKLYIIRNFSEASITYNTAKTTLGGSLWDKEVIVEPISISSLWLTRASNLEQVINPFQLMARNSWENW